MPTIVKTSPDSKYFSYRTNDIGNCEGGISHVSFIRIVDRSDFLTDELKKKNVFIWPYDNKEMGWSVSDIFWLSDGPFFAQNGVPMPIDGGSFYYFDKNQDKKWAIYDSFKENDNPNKKDFRLTINDVFKKQDGGFMFLYELGRGTNEAYYYIKEAKIGDKIDFYDTKDAKLVMQEKDVDVKLYYNDEEIKKVTRISDIYFLNENTIIYNKKSFWGQLGSLHMYNIKDGKSERIEQFFQESIY